jgi:hypothetical protein
MRISDQPPYAIEWHIKVFGEVQGWNHFVGRLRQMAAMRHGPPPPVPDERVYKKWLA